MADEPTNEEVTDETETAETETPLEGDEAKVEDDGDKFDPERALEKIRKLNSENKNLRDAKKSAEEKAAGSSEKDTRIKALEAENLRIRIGARHGLPDELIDRLKGDTEEDILADAEKLLGLVSTRKVPPTRRPAERPGTGTQPDAPTEETDVRKLGARMFQR